MGDAKKEATILRLTEALLERQVRLHNTLDELISRTKNDTGGDTVGKPLLPNVLDEIIDNLEMALDKEQWAINAVASQIVAKIQ